RIDDRRNGVLVDAAAGLDRAALEKGGDALDAERIHAGDQLAECMNDAGYACGAKMRAIVGPADQPLVRGDLEVACTTPAGVRHERFKLRNPHHSPWRAGCLCAAIDTSFGRCNSSVNRKSFRYAEGVRSARRRPSAVLSMVPRRDRVLP